MQDEYRISSEANDGGTALELRCVTDDSSSVSYPARMRIYARDEQHNVPQISDIHPAYSMKQDQTRITPH